MAIYPHQTAFAQESASVGPNTQPINIEEWTEQATQALNAATLASQGGVRGTSVSLAIDLDEKAISKVNEDGEVPSTQRPRREPLRRDSMKRREALLKGKEGSRRRTRWENDHLLNNPWAQPPLPSDWEVRPTYPKRSVPYYLAPLWDQEVYARARNEERTRAAAQKQNQTSNVSDKIPRELREKLKKAKAAKGLLKDLEEQVRLFVQRWEDTSKSKEADAEPEMDSEDEEIVFVGRNGKMNDVPASPKLSDSQDEIDIGRDTLVFDSLANDHGASFGRWLVHSIATYYGLSTWSITVGDPARREAHVGIPSNLGNGRPPSPVLQARPLWGMV